MTKQAKLEGNVRCERNKQMHSKLGSIKHKNSKQRDVTIDEKCVEKTRSCVFFCLRSKSKVAESINKNKTRVSRIKDHAAGT